MFKKLFELPTVISFDFKSKEAKTLIEAINITRDKERVIIVFYQAVDSQRYYLGTVRVNDVTDKNWYVILDDLSTEFTMDEVMSEFTKRFEIQMKQGAC